VIETPGNPSLIARATIFAKWSLLANAGGAVIVFRERTCREKDECQVFRCMRSSSAHLRFQMPVDSCSAWFRVEVAASVRSLGPRHCIVANSRLFRHAFATSATLGSGARCSPEQKQFRRCLPFSLPKAMPGLPRVSAPGAIRRMENPSPEQ
jgi:hypothetical protein